MSAGIQVPPLRVALLSTFTVDLLADRLAERLAALGLAPEVYVGPFGQYRQMVLDPGSEFYRFAPDVVVLLLDGADLFRDVWESPWDHPRDQVQQRVAVTTAEIDHTVRSIAAHRPGCQVLLSNVYAPPRNALGLAEGHGPWSVKAYASACNDFLRTLVDQHPNVLILDQESAVLRLGYDAWVDERLWYLARMRLSAAATDEVARVCAATVRATLRLSRKCLVVDLDNTLWGGVVGEDGLAGLRLGGEGLGAAFRDFQQEILNLAKRGVVLAISSRNNLEDAAEVFRRHPDMVLRWDHFAAVRIDWRDKVTHLRELSSELNLGLDSFVFIDDQPAERSLVRRYLPEVEVVELSPDPVRYRRALLELDSFAAVTVTPEDSGRTAMYQAQNRREALRLQSGSLEDFYRSLEMRVRIELADDVTAPRVAQITQRTNQFSLTTRRYTDEQIRQFCASPGHAVYALTLEDRFGDNGLVGAAIFVKETARMWRLDLFALSCRAMGRTVETAFLAALLEDAAAAGVECVRAEFIPTAKNTPACEFLPKHGFGRDESSPHGWTIAPARTAVRRPEWIRREPRGQKEAPR